ncbi:MAG: succinate dehydrogenase [Hyphomicrobiales bacterium]|nr:succinate dehydrogenase [Hyphomicrobiales bacterium]
MSFKLYLLQRGTAVLLLPLILVHLAVIFYATAKGLSAASILSRTRGSVGWAAFYGLFVVAAAIHGAIGVRNVVSEWGPDALKRDPRLLALILWGTGIVLCALGLRAVYAVVMT